MTGTDGKKLSGESEPGILTESVLAAQITNDAYTSTEQFVAKKEEKRESLHVPSVAERDVTETCCSDDRGQRRQFRFSVPGELYKRISVIKQTIR